MRDAIQEESLASAVMVQALLLPSRPQNALQRHSHSLLHTSLLQTHKGESDGLAQDSLLLGDALVAPANSTGNLPAQSDDSVYT